MATVTISRQLGSLGSEVARAAADRLGYRLVWRDVINQAARRAGAPEVALAAIDELGLLGLCPTPKACHAYHQAVRQVMEELAKEGGVVILGRAGQVILRDHPGALHVRVIAPQRLRVERVARRHGVSLQAAAAQVEASDRYRHHYLRRFYHVRADDPELYDLIINTERMTPEGAANLIYDALSTRQESAPQPGVGAARPFAVAPALAYPPECGGPRAPEGRYSDEGTRPDAESRQTLAGPTRPNGGVPGSEHDHTLEPI